MEEGHPIAIPKHYHVFVCLNCGAHYIQCTGLHMNIMYYHVCHMWYLVYLVYNKLSSMHVLLIDEIFL